MEYVDWLGRLFLSTDNVNTSQHAQKMSKNGNRNYWYFVYCTTRALPAHIDCRFLKISVVWMCCSEFSRHVMSRKECVGQSSDGTMFTIRCVCLLLHTKPRLTHEGGGGCYSNQNERGSNGGGGRGKSKRQHMNIACIFFFFLVIFRCTSSCAVDLEPVTLSAYY